MPYDRPGHRALEHIDQALQDRPNKNDHALSQATMCLAEFRNHLTAEWREKGIGDVQRKQLAHVNAVITVVLGIHFPLDGIPWDELDKARTWLSEVVAVDEPAA